MRRSIYRAIVCLLVAGSVLSASGHAKTKMVGPKLGTKTFRVLPEVGSEVKLVLPMFKAPAFCVAGSGHFDNCFNAFVDGIKFQVNCRKTAHGRCRVEEIRTTDPQFKTPGGLSVGNVVTITSIRDLKVSPTLAFDRRSDGDWLPIIGEIPGPVIVAGPDGKESWIGYDDLHLDGQPVRLKISGFLLGSERLIAAGNQQANRGL